MTRKLEPLESRAKVLEEEVTKLMVDLLAFEQRVTIVKRRERDAKAIQ